MRLIKYKYIIFIELSNWFQIRHSTNSLLFFAVYLPFYYTLYRFHETIEQIVHEQSLYLSL